MSDQSLTNTTPMVVLGNKIMVLPGTIAYLTAKSELVSKLFQEVLDGKFSTLVVVLGDETNSNSDKFFSVGVACEVTAETVGDENRLYLRGMFRTRILRWKKLEKEGYWIADWMLFGDKSEDFYQTHRGKGILRQEYRFTMRGIRKEIRMLLVEIINDSGNTENSDIESYKSILSDMDSCNFYSLDSLDYFIWAALISLPDIEPEEKYEILSSPSLMKRLNLLMEHLSAALEVEQIRRRVHKGLTGKVHGEDIKRESKPRPQLEAGRTETKDNDPDNFAKAHPEIVKKWGRYREIKEFMNEDARNLAMEDFARLKAIKHPQNNSHDWTKYSGRLDFNLSLPWNVETEQEKDITKVTKILDEDHYGLDHVKDIILDCVAPLILNPTGKSNIICFDGPPGVGKTSLGKSIARALNRKFIRISLGGVQDETAIRGHRITYVGSEPGMILREIQRCGSKNPVFMIDEIDKLGSRSTAGDPSSAMLEVLDPEQNNNFRDHYLDAGFDLSKVLFVATSNVEHNIPEPLRDRMNVIRISSYLEPEKVEIAKKFLIPKLIKEIGLLKPDEPTKPRINIEWADGILEKIIQDHTNEAGVRNLNRSLERILKRVSREFLESQISGKNLEKFMVNEGAVLNFLGQPKSFKNKARPTTVGQAIGLAWTPTGGSILYIESKLLPSFKNNQFVFSHTGYQGKVMEESTKVALSLVRGKLGEESVGLLEGKSIHLHVPEGAIPKDGPSAGITFFCSLYSAIKGRVVKPYLAMTGEVCLSGVVMPVGGIREKVVGAHRAGIKEVILPRENGRDIESIPAQVKEEIKIHLVETIEDVMEIATIQPDLKT